MVSKFALLSSLLLASVALAIPSSRLGDRLARRRENRQSQPPNPVTPPSDAVPDIQYSTNWAGAVWQKDEKSFTTVTGTFTVPAPSHDRDGGASAWVGIDGSSCSQAILQTGVDFTVTDGRVSYHAWYEWYPDYAYDFVDISVGAGDVIKATVTAYSTTSGIAIIENKTTGQTVKKDLSSSTSLCEKDAEWIVEDFEQGGSLVPFIDFGTVKFTESVASGPRGTYTPEGATIWDIVYDDEVVTSVTTGYETVTVKYVG